MPFWEESKIKFWMEQSSNSFSAAYVWKTFAFDFWSVTPVVWEMFIALSFRPDSTFNETKIKSTVEQNTYCPLV